MPTPQQKTAMSEKLESNLRQFIFEPHNETTWEKITQSFYDLLNADVEVQSFAVKCDAENNILERVAAGELWCDIAIIHNGDKDFTYYALRVTNKLALEGNGDVTSDSN